MLCTCQSIGPSQSAITLVSTPACRSRIAVVCRSTWAVTVLPRSGLTPWQRWKTCAVEALAAWRRAGHYLHITSHRSADAHAATERWLEQNGVACDDLHCSTDKIARCVELEIDLLIDDSPVNLERALDAGMRAATNPA